MTTDERFADLEARIAKFERYFTFKTNPHDGSMGVMTQGRFGVMTEYWMNQPRTQGAALSVGTATDRFAGYFEIDEAVCLDHPSVAVYAASIAPNDRQMNVAVEAVSANSSPAPTLVVTGDGVLIAETTARWLIGKIGKTIKQLWP